MSRGSRTEEIDYETLMLRITVQRTVLELPFAMVCQMLPIIKSSKSQAIRSLTLLGAIAALHPESPTKAQISMIDHVLNALETAIEEQWRNQEEMLIRTTYFLLCDGTINRKQAAAVARAALGKDINSENWRKRVDRYASAPERKWPLPGKPRRTKRAPQLGLE